MISPSSVYTTVSELQVNYNPKLNPLDTETKQVMSITGDLSISDRDQMLDRVRLVTKELRSDWYSLAIELDIDYDTRKVCA